MRISYRLGLDIGTNSIGWCVLRLDEDGRPAGLVRPGSRIFSDGRDPGKLTTLAATRRAYRQARRRHDRVLKRQAHFMQALIEHGLMPADGAARQALAKEDPYELRRRGAHEALTAHEFGRALYHLAKRRGFQSSRKEMGKGEEDAGLLNAAISQTEQAIEQAECKTLGEYLAKLRAEGKRVRARLASHDKGYELYVNRAMVTKEFDRLWSVQSSVRPDIYTEAARDCLRTILLFQRQLLPVEPGPCTFETTEARIPVCSPLFQRFRILQELNSLRIREPDTIDERPLTLVERDTLLTLLSTSTSAKAIPLDALRSAIGLDKRARFTHEIGTSKHKRKGAKGGGGRTGFKADATAALAKVVGDIWQQLDDLQREALAVLIENAANNDELRKALQLLPELGDREKGARRVIRSRDNPDRIEPWLQALNRWPVRLPAKQIELLLKIRLPDDHASLSRKALERIVPYLETEVITYDRAARAAGYSHFDPYSGDEFSRLPYYGQVLRNYVSPHPHRLDVTQRPADTDKSGDLEKYYGRITNPTVHIGLNQLRLVVNEIIRRWGPPQEIVVELAREFGLSGKRRLELREEQKTNSARNEKLNERLRMISQKENYKNRARLKLWDELGKGDQLVRTCLYSGKKLALTPSSDAACVFSSEVEADHILPRSGSLDDSLSNRVLCVRQANQDKRNRDPFAAFAHSPPGYDWNEILVRAANLPHRKAMRLRETAMEDYCARAQLDPETLKAYGFVETEGYLARHLIDTSYLARAARQYLTAICPPNKVWVVPGRLTAKLRGIWDLNDILDPEHQGKNRNDHRHHAIDAVVVGVCDRGMIQRMMKAAEEAEKRASTRLMKNLQPPWPGFHEELKAAISRVVVSHKPDKTLSVRQKNAKSGLRTTTGELHEAGNYGWRSGPAKKNGAPLVTNTVPLENIEYKNVTSVEGKRGRPSPKIADTGLRDELLERLEGLSKVEIRKELVEIAQRTNRRKVLLTRRLTVHAINNKATGQPYRWVASGNNFCSIIYRTPDGGWGGRVITALDANRIGFDLRKERGDHGETVVMRLQKDDMLRIEQNERQVVMRVVKLSGDEIFLTPHTEANASARKVVKGYSPEQLRMARARLVGVDPLGYVNDPGFQE